MAKRLGYLDLQVNGYAGVDLNEDHLTAEQLHQCCARLEADGVDGVLATIVTSPLAAMADRLRRLATLRAADPLARRLIVGVHIEGPFLNEQIGYRGAHPAECIHPADADEMARLLEAAGGLTRLVTLAPERDPGLRVTRLLVAQGIKVAAGHCDPSLDQLHAAFDAGLSLFTHLGNGCPMQLHRHDNIIQRALSLSDRVICCFIADGAHVAFPALGNYLRLAGHDRAVVVTDAMPAAGKGPGRYQFGRFDLLIGEDLVARAPDGSHLVGSAMTMPQAERNLIEKVGLTPAVAARLTRRNPRAALGL